MSSLGKSLVFDQRFGSGVFEAMLSGPEANEVYELFHLQLVSRRWRRVITVLTNPTPLFFFLSLPFCAFSRRSMCRFRSFASSKAPANVYPIRCNWQPSWNTSLTRTVKKIRRGSCVAAFRFVFNGYYPKIVFIYYSRVFLNALAPAVPALSSLSSLFLPERSFVPSFFSLCWRDSSICRCEKLAVAICGAGCSV